MAKSKPTAEVSAEPRTSFAGSNEQAVQTVLFAIFSTIDRKHFENIRIGKFKVEDMLKLDESFVSASNRATSANEATQMARSKEHFLRLPIIYSQIGLSTASPVVRYYLSMAQLPHMRNLLTMMDQNTRERVGSWRPATVSVCEARKTSY
ncbi:hypothetical protein G7Y79_00006g019020 [Physcia stellaris]|nr:hypothetical protein G7Y79_00006g019020 [Physcia stellaris]